MRARCAMFSEAAGDGSPQWLPTAVRGLGAAPQGGRSRSFSAGLVRPGTNSIQMKKGDSRRALPVANPSSS